MEILNTEITDLETVYEIYKAAIAYQIKKGYEQWPLFEQEIILTEIKGKRHWKINVGNKIAGVFSVLYSDPIIWQDMNKDPAVYLHRIAVHPHHKGKSLIGIVRDWAIAHALHLNKNFVRMDTWGNNINIRNYYVSHGFNYLGQTFLDPARGQEHYGGNELSLLQIAIP